MKCNTNLKSVLFLTKDALCLNYLPQYGNKFWAGKTPNLDELAAQGTVFTNAFTAAPSSAMSYLTMFTRKYPYQQEIKAYVPLVRPYKGRTLFDDAYDMGYDCHVVWDDHWIKLAERYSKCYGNHTTMHPLKGLRQGVGPNYKREHPLERNDVLAEQTFAMFKDEIKQIFDNGKNVFLWCHLPHVLNGRISYGDDIDLYDRYIGFLRQYFEDNNIFISSDHGNMNGTRGKIRYGFDVYDPAIRIPLISPRINDLKIYEGQFCNIDFFELLFERKIVKRDVIFSDCAYYAQPRRKLAIIFGKYRYIYNKKDKLEELYDVDWDPHQDFNLMADYVYDIDRKVNSPSRELYFYPYWDNLPAIKKKLREEKNGIWRDVSWKQNLLLQSKEFVKKTPVISKVYPILLKFFRR